MEWLQRQVARCLAVGRTRWRTVDATIALVVGTTSLIGYFGATLEGSQRGQDAGGALLIAAMALVLAGRRRHPLWAMLATVPLEIAFWVADYPTEFDVFPIVTLYTATAHSGESRDRVWAWTSAAIATYTAVAVIGVLSPSEDLPAVALIGLLIVFGASAMVGELVHERRERISALEERAERAEAERELLARQAVLGERARIARELHDVVAHAMSVMVVQAGAAERVVESSPERAREALVNIQESGREALADMRHMLGLLRDGERPVELSPQPGVDDLDQIVRHCTEAGVPTELIVEGARPPRSSGAEMALYRVAQEALTNVIKHAGRPAHAMVRVAFAPDLLRVEITDDGMGASSEVVERSTGHGLVGMRERVEMYRGTLHAGPRPGGGFRVAATIPWQMEDR